MNSETVGLVCVAGSGCFGAFAVFARWRMNAWRRAARAARVVKVRALVTALVRGTRNANIEQSTLNAERREDGFYMQNSKNTRG